MLSRRHFATTAALASVASLAKAAPKDQLVIGSNTYPWGKFAQRGGEDFSLHSVSLLTEMKKAGLQSYEPIVAEPSEFTLLKPRLAEVGLTMPSVYLSSRLHEPELIVAEKERLLTLAEAALTTNTRIFVTNPDPIKWGSNAAKSDAQLRLQAQTLDELGANLRKKGLTLAYHNHDMELRHGAREFHHMLTATSPENVKFCLDAHWIFRGCGNSEVAVFDVLRNYQDRIVELHLRQSTNGVWNEVFSLRGDIDYQKLLNTLSKNGPLPHLVLEQAVEKGSPKTLNATEAHRKGQVNLRAALSAES